MKDAYSFPEAKTLTMLATGKADFIIIKTLPICEFSMKGAGS